MDAAGWRCRYATVLESSRKHLSAAEGLQIADLGRSIFEAGVLAEDIAATHVVCVKDLTAAGRSPHDVLECTTARFVELMKGYGEAAAQHSARLHQQELAHVTRLSTVGEMAAGLAHEINQPLFAISNYAEGSIRKLQSQAATPEELSPTLQKIAEQAQRAGEIIRRLRSFVQKGEPKRERLSINDLAREVTRFVEGDARAHNIRIDVDLGDEPRTVEVDKIQIQQVLVNLVRNSIEAMQDDRSGKRVLTIRTSVIDDKEVEVAVCDTGHGISSDVAGHIFDPFVSTKALGLGMGLSISRTIVETHDGRVWATPNPDRGVTFHVTLPLAPEPILDAH